MQQFHIHKKHFLGLKEFLAACGDREPSANASPYGLAFAEGGVEGPHRVVF